MKFLLYLMMVLWIGLYWLSQAQYIAAPNLDPPGFCAQDNLHEQQLLTDTTYAYRHAVMEEQIAEFYRMPPNTEVGAWDGYLEGRVMKPAVFAYRAIVQYIDGTVEVIDGNVALIR